MNRVHVVQYGLGPIGMECIRALLRRPGLELVGAVDMDPQKVGKDAGLLAGAGRELGILVEPEPKQLLRRVQPEVVLHTTQSTLEAVAQQVRLCVEAGAHVISSTEELFWPWHRHPDLAAELDRKAQEAGVVIVGTGVNPGFVMDVFPLVLTSQCVEVRRIEVRRVVDAAKRRLPLQRKVGAGLRPEEFRALADGGKLGHVGLVESLFCLASTLGWKLDSVDEKLVPVLADREVSTPYLTVTPGCVAGIRHACRGLVGGREVIFLELQMYVGAEAPHDEVRIDGDPPVHVVVPGGIFGDTATVASLLNAIPRVLAAKPGLRTMPELSLPHGIAWATNTEEKGGDDGRRG
ncbi:MAG: dihydrodipicolinate reductase [candidate division KSB1 bacterium]|nr:dihydrodipicolinate reductase [candidate division KSB1 bacterium]